MIMMLKLVDVSVEILLVFNAQVQLKEVSMYVWVG